MSGDHATFGTAPGGAYVSSEGIVQQGVTEVDVESVASAVTWLDGLKSYIQTRLIPDTGKMMITQGDTQVWFGWLEQHEQGRGPAQLVREGDHRVLPVVGAVARRREPSHRCVLK